MLVRMVEKREPLRVVGGTINGYIYYGNCMEILQKLKKQSYQIMQQSHFCIFVPRI